MYAVPGLFEHVVQERLGCTSPELSLGNQSAALAWLQPTVAILRDVGYVEPGIFFFLPHRLETLIATGQHEDAERGIAEWEEPGHRFDRPFALALATGARARARGTLLAACDRLTEAGDALNQARREHERLDWPHQHARTLLAHGRVLRRIGRRRDARSDLDRALQIFNRVGEGLWARQLRDEINRLGGRTRPVTSSPMGNSGWLNWSHVAAAIVKSQPS